MTYIKQFYVNDLKEGMEFVDFFMAKGPALKVGANKKVYFDITLADKTGSVSGKKWDVSPDESGILETIAEGDLVKIRANVVSYKDIKQLRITRIRKATEEDELSVKDYIKAAPESPESMYEYLWNTTEAMKDEELKRLCQLVLDSNKEKLHYYPAAAKNHHAEFAGLLYHLKRMVMHGIVLCDIYTFLNKDLLIAGVLLHDMEKLTEIEANRMGISTGYSFEGNMLGHLVQGVKRVDRWAEEIGIGHEKSIMLQHMMISHHYEPEFGSPKKPLFPEAEALHYLDMMDAKMYDFEEAISGTEPGQFSDRVWTLDNRRIYKSTERE
ncbi:MAG: CMP-binding protein [Peptostreptococcaceae bacterium]|nr:CMP-binding protein [Peptostreptococcaceae bacterium]MDY5739368.1 hypothetical protein [Anaerovoracaceae bacterium]